MFQDKTLICKECGEEFVFTAGEQEFYEEKGLKNEPSRCRTCRQNRKDALIAERQRNNNTEVRRKCMMRFALSAELLLRCLSSPKRTVRFTAMSAIRLCADNVQIKTAC